LESLEAWERTLKREEEAMKRVLEQNPFCASSRGREL